MIRNALPALLLVSFLIHTACAQEKPPAPAAPAAVAVPAAAAVPAAETAPVQPQVSEIQRLAQRQHELSQELAKMRAKIYAEHPDLVEKTAALKTKASELRKQAAALDKQARALRKEASEMTAQGADKMLAEVDPDFATKSKELADTLTAARQARLKQIQERHQRRKTSLRRMPTPPAPVVPPTPKVGE